MRVYVRMQSCSPLLQQAIKNPSDDALQEKAWDAVVPLVAKLKKFYEFSQRLGKSATADQPTH